MKKIICAMLLATLVITLSGCTKIEGTLHEVGEKLKSEQLDTPQSGSASRDWSFVPVVREMAVKTFTDAFPDATVTETGVACKTTGADRVIVTLTYQLNGKTGSYGFDYEKNEQGEYILKRYGGGVSSDDL